MKNINLNLKWTFLVIVLSIASCCEVELKISDPVIPESDRVVLIEELSGAHCTNCPKGSAAVENIINKYPGRVHAVAIHGELLSDPIIGKSKYDFRHPKAKDLENWFKPWYGKPAASINRAYSGYSDEPYAISSPDLWQAEVEKELQKDHQLNLILESNYDESTRLLEIDLAAIPLVDLSGNYNVSVYLIESKIIDAQTNGAIIEENYVHNHVLRDMLTKFDGDAFGTNLTKGAILNRKYSYTLPSTPEGLWQPKNMAVVAMISHQGNNDKSIVQAAEVHVQE